MNIIDQLKTDDIYIIGDVHGCYKTLMALIAQFPSDAYLCFVGDLIDRGPDSAKVVDFVRSNGHACVLGNHEQLMIDSIPPGPYGATSTWFGNGGLETIESYANSDAYESDLEWMKSLPISISYPNVKRDGRFLLVSHSSYAKYYTKQEEDDEYVIWNRDVSREVLEHHNPFYNIFGHTVQAQPLITDYFACIDTGGVFAGNSKYGKLTAIHFPSLTVYQQPNIEQPEPGPQ